MSNLRRGAPHLRPRDAGLSNQDLPELQRKIRDAANGTRLARSRGAALQAAIDAHLESRKLSDAASAVARMGYDKVEVLRERAELEANFRCLRRREQDARTLIESDGELLALERARAQQRTEQLRQARASLDELFKREVSNIEEQLANVIEHSYGLLNEQSAAMHRIHQEGRSLQERLRKADADMEKVANELPGLLSSCSSNAAESKKLEAQVPELRRSNCDLLSDMDEHTSARDGLRQRSRVIGIELRDLDQQSKEFEGQRLSCTSELGRATVEQLDLLDCAHASSARHRRIQSQKDAVVATRNETLLRRKSHAFAEAANVPPCGELTPPDDWPRHAGVIWRKDLMVQ